ncbi:hypothetical protein ABBQ32_007179 [Trebouxia sp. C0010 RCD-2024]
MADRTVRIAVIGDEGVGKSSLVLAAVHNTFNDNPVPTLPPTRLPADTVESYVAPAPATLIVDTCSKEEDKQAWDLNVQQADALVLTFAANDFNSLRRVVTHWIPELERLGTRKPIILCACKCDLGSIHEERFQELVQLVLSEYKHIETFLESSAKKQQSIPDIFYYAVKSVIHPAEPLVEFHTAALKPLCVKALKRVFLLCDANQDGALNDEELNHFQIRCFHAPLQPTELAGVKEVVGERLPGGLSNNGLTLKGFLFLHALFIEKARTETVWTVLRSFGYSDELLIKDDLLDNVDFTRQPDQTIELSEDGRNFLQQLFQAFDENQDKLLSEAEQREMFSAAPASPFDDDDQLKALMVQKHEMGLTLKGFTAQWAYLTNSNPRKALEHMMYLGLPMEPSFMQRQFSISKTRQQERRRGKDLHGRGVFQCLVFGASGAGKSSLLEGLIRTQGEVGSGISPADEGSPRKAPAAHVAANEIIFSHGRRQQTVVSATLILREMQELQLLELQRNPAAFTESCDVAAFVFDSSSVKSFRAAHQLLLLCAGLAQDTLPCMLIAAKDDLGISMDIQDNCSKIAQDLRLPVPMHVSSQTHEGSPVYASLVEAALSPAKHIPETPTLAAKRRAELTSRRTAVFAVASVAVVALFYLGYRYNAMDLVETSDSTSSSQDSSAGRDRNTTDSGSPQSRRDIGAYVRGLFRTWSH